MKNKMLLEILLDGIQSDSRLPDILNPESIKSLPFHPDSEVRSLTSEILAVEDPQIDSEALLLQLSRDEDSLVRTNAVDSLSNYPTERSYAACIAALSDADPLVRSYAVFGTAVIGKALDIKGVIQVLEGMRDQEQDSQVLAALGEARYILGDESGLQELFGLYPSGDCQLQCAILNHLQEILNANNCAQIRSFVENIRDNSSAPAVQSNIEELLDIVNETGR